MDKIMSSYLAVSGGIESAKAEALMPILNERGRGFASDAETWAELKAALERIKKKQDAAERQHKEMWDAVKDKNRDGFKVLIETFERSAVDLAGEWVRMSALASIFINEPELPEEPTPEEQNGIDKITLQRVRTKMRDINRAMPYAWGEVETDLSAELARLTSEEARLIIRMRENGAPQEYIDERPEDAAQEQAADSSAEENSEDAGEDAPAEA